MRKKIFSLAAILSGLFLWGCYPNGPTYTEDLDIVLTHHNPDYDFVAKNTYAMPNVIVKITGKVLQEGELPETVKDIYAREILQHIADNMEFLGWTRVAVDASPDVYLVPAAWETTSIVYYYDYWYWWWGGYYPYYPYYPVYTYSYTTGTLLMNIYDPTLTSTNGNRIPQWTGALNGVMNDVYNDARISRLILQAFDQSPYLQTQTK